MDTDLYYGKDGESFFDAADEDERITERALREAGAALTFTDQPTRWRMVSA